MKALLPYFCDCDKFCGLKINATFCLCRLCRNISWRQWPCNWNQSCKTLVGFVPFYVVTNDLQYKEALGGGTSFLSFIENLNNWRFIVTVTVTEICQAVVESFVENVIFFFNSLLKILESLKLNKCIQFILLHMDENDWKSEIKKIQKPRKRFFSKFQISIFSLINFRNLY